MDGSSNVLNYVEKEYSEPDVTETETFLTEEGVRNIIEKAMKKQRLDLKLSRKTED